jgi:KDO2-lipid IV(A) lauroyltransferase
MRHAGDVACGRTPPGRAADVRLGSSWTFGQRAKNDALWLLASLALGACRPLPLHALRWLGRRLGLAAMLLAPRARATSLENLARVFPSLSDRERRTMARRCFGALGEYLGETVAMLGPHPPRVLDVAPDAKRVFREALDQGRGVVFASAHLGPWERVAASLAAARIPMVVLGRESYDPRFTRLYSHMRQAHGLEIVWRGQAGAARRILRTLRNNQVLGVPMDLRSRVTSCQAPFLGHLAATPVGPARIALRAGSPVIVGTASPRDIGRTSGAGDRPQRDDAPPEGTLVVTATAVQTADLAPDVEGARELTRRINSELSRRILALPHGWVWMHERWDAAPEPG